MGTSVVVGDFASSALAVGGLSDAPTGFAAAAAALFNRLL